MTTVPVDSQQNSLTVPQYATIVAVETLLVVAFLPLPTALNLAIGLGVGSLAKLIDEKPKDAETHQRQQRIDLTMNVFLACAAMCLSFQVGFACGQYTAERPGFATRSAPSYKLSPK